MRCTKAAVMAGAAWVLVACGGVSATAEGPATYAAYASALTGDDPVKRLGNDTWFQWTAGNQVFWGQLFPMATRGQVDLLRVLDARVVLRAKRFQVLGVINDPSCQAPTAPDQFGFLIDTSNEPQTDSDKQTYGVPTGIVGLRRFPNPGFDPNKWASAGGALGYLTQTSANYDPGLQPPYLIGMACAVCHVSFDPLHPPADPDEPDWGNLTPAIGNQYLKEAAIFTLAAKPGEFRWQVGQTQEPGTSDTSRIPDDFLNNPTAINPVFGLPARLGIRTYESVTDAQAQFIAGMVPAIAADLKPGPPPKMLTAHGLIDGADSLGFALGGLRVYANIGGLDPAQFLAAIPSPQNGYTQRPFDPVLAKANPSGLWKATEPRMPAIVQFLASLPSMSLAQAPNGSQYLDDPPHVVARGQIVFAGSCAWCHSSKQPNSRIVGRGARRRAYEELVTSPNFLQDNFLSDDRRYPVTEIQTNVTRALATNATTGQIWDYFSS